MTEKQKQILDLIKYQITIDDLSKETGLSLKQSYQRINSLINSGYNIFRKDFSSGVIQFGLSNSEQIKCNSKVIYTPSNTDSIRTIVISDTHLGNTKERLDVLDSLYNYCTKHNIHLIFNCGDFLNGMLRSMVGEIKYKDYENQLEKSLKNYPFDPHILNYVILGNHDMDYLSGGNINIKTAIERKRYDILPISSEEGYIKIKNDEIHMIHPNSDNGEARFSHKIIFRGHSHKAKAKNCFPANSAYFYVPTLSDMFYDNEYAFPSMYDVIYNFNESGLINEICVSTYIYADNKFIKTNEYNSKFSNPLKFDEIKYEENPKVFVSKNTEEKKEETPKVLTKKITSGMSQIEKFRARYGNTPFTK